MAGAINRLVARDGVSLSVLEAGGPERPTIVFLHGYPDTKTMWLPVLERLAGEYHVVAYDTRGAGESTAPRGPRAYVFDELRADFEAVCDAVAPGKRVHLVGHDWGGIQGWEFAASPRLRDRLASFTTIAGPALGHAVRATRLPLTRGRVLRALGRIRRSWYIVPMVAPGGPTLAWRVVMSRARWRQVLQVAERVPVDDEYPAASLRADGLHGSNLYRANVLPRLFRSGRLERTSVPVQVVVPSGDRFIADSYYDAAEELTDHLRHRRLAGSHWAPRSQPELIARWIGEFVGETEAGEPRPTGRWRRGGGVEQLAGKLAVVTGAGSGIGLATATALAGHGARVVLVDRDETGLARAAESIPGSRSLECDVSDPEAMESLAAEVLESEGVPDVVVNNAGIGIAGSFLDTGVADWRRIVDINLLGVVHGCRLFGRAMVERGAGGHIVNTASAAAYSPNKALSAYSATKAAVLMLSECVRAELVPHGIGVTAVCPGVIATNITRATQYVGRPAAEEKRLREEVSRLYERRNFTPDRVAAEIVEAIGADRPVAVVTLEAKVMRAISRLSPGLSRRMAGLYTLPI